MLKRRRFLSVLVVLCMLLSMFPMNTFAQSERDEDFMMTLKTVKLQSWFGTSEVSYLNTQGFSVFLNNTNFDRTFGDQKCAGMEMILHGERIATDGDIRLLPTPEQWDGCPTSDDHGAKGVTLYNNGAFNDFNFTYKTEVIPEPGGFKVSVSLDDPLPERLVGRAGFNLEFLPTIYRNKTYFVDGGKTGLIPGTPSSPMVEMPVPNDDPLKRNSWQKQWDEDRGDYQPLPLVTGSSIILAPEDEMHRVKITSDNGTLSLYDGRTKAQNGWFVLRTLIPAGKTGEVLTWHIRPNVIQNWTRDPVITYSQVGYAIDHDKSAVIELDPLYDAPQKASILRLNEEGYFEKVFEKKLTDPIPFTRYNYQTFDFKEVNKPGTYAIEYDGVLTDSFQIADNVYSDTWQDSLVCFLAEQMDHMKVRDGYLIRHGLSHMDDARQAPANLSFFDGWSMGADINSPYAPGEHIPGLNVGGFYDAGDFDIQTGSNISIIQDMVNAYKGFNLSYDNLTVNQEARDVEMHRPDGIPDAVQLAKHGVLQLLAQIDAVGHTFPVIEVPTLRQYTHLGDGATDTDGKIYTTDPSEIYSVDLDTIGYSSIPDDRLAFTSSSYDSSAYAAFAASAWALKGWDNALAEKCLTYAQNIWDKQPHDATSGWGLSGEWNAAIYLMLATYGDKDQAKAYEVYKARVKELSSAMFTSSNVASASLATFILPYMDNEFKEAYKNAAAAYVTSYKKSMEPTPYGIATMSPGSMWGGSQGVCTTGANMYFLHKAFPNIVSGEYTLQVANYILGRHPVNSTSWVAGVGKNSKTWTYSNNRAYETNIPGGILPGYVVISPDFPECIDNFGMLWFEHETCTADVSKWVVAALGASAVAGGIADPGVTFTVTDGTNGIKGAEVTVGSVYEVNVDTNEVYSIDPDTHIVHMTDSNGKAKFDLDSGDYAYIVTKGGYDTASGTFSVLSSDAAFAKTVMLERNSSHHGGSSSGRTSTQKASAPTADPGSGTYTSAQSVRLSTSTGGSSIYYTTDGTTPTSASTLYNKAISVSKSMKIKAIAIKSGYTNSSVATFTYTINDKPDETTFSDVSGHWAESYIAAAVKAGYVSGFKDGTFRPDDNVTRAQFVKMIVAAFGFTGTGDTTFADSKSHWALSQIEIAANNNLVTGVTQSNGVNFLPDNNISREQVAAILYRVAEKLGITLPKTSDATSFGDQGEISSYAAAAVAAMQKAGIIGGSESNGKIVFLPQGNATRAQAIKMIQGLLDLY